MSGVGGATDLEFDELPAMGVWFVHHDGLERGLPAGSVFRRAETLCLNQVGLLY